MKKPTKPSSSIKSSTKNSSKPSSKIPQKASQQKPKEINNKLCAKKEEKKEKEKENLDKRAFVSKESPNLIEKIDIKPKLNMKCIKTVQAHDDWVEKALILESG